jgi:hypothetical protein
LNSLDAYDLSNGWVLLIDGRGLLIDGGILVRILYSGGITVYNLSFRRAPAYKIDLKATLTRSLSFIEWINYKARDLIKFKRGKRFNGSDLFLDFLFSLFY